MFLFALLAAALIPSPVPESGSLRGEAAIETFGARGLIVYVDTNRDDSFDHVFRLQVEGRSSEAIGADVKLDQETGAEGTSTPTPGPSYFSNAAVEFAPGYVRIFSGSDAIELFVDGTQSAAWNPAGARVWRRAGYGLIHEVRETGIAIQKRGRERSITAEYCDASSDCDPGDTTDPGGTWPGGSTLCDAGGPGSTSCSVSNSGGTCTSTCGTGYYACCMYGAPPKCRCIRG
jgi:hypothetical protein